ncbi:MAG: hypothetical protein JSW72_03885 [Candidatus Bathyarchaeota archaeon]|nr:MAG: hypothetical protein JSW72_03885 [Candidatus Bathyarchaeota archaeon]
MNPLKRLILGHLPFIGISYQGKERDKEYHRRFSEMTTTRKVVEASIKCGIHRFAAATIHSAPLSSVHLQVLRLLIREGYNIELLPCIEIPLKLEGHGIDAYRRWATYASIEVRLYPEAKRRMLTDPILNFREDWKYRVTRSIPYKEADFPRLNIDWNMIDEDLQFFTQLPVSQIEFGSEADFLAISGRFDLMNELVKRAQRHGFPKVLFGVHHAGTTIPRLEDNLKAIQGYVTPLNPLGVMMFPTKPSAEQAARNTAKPVFAIKPLAGGRTSPKKAFTYISNFDVEGCFVGVGSIRELKENIEAAKYVAENLS